MSHAQRFSQLFWGNSRFHGTYDTDGGKGRTVKDSLSVDLFAQHIDGKKSLGVCPIADDNKVTFAVIDIDNHGPNAQTLEKPELFAQTIWEKTSGVVLPCLSKSGGLHLYRFYSEPVGASAAIKEMTSIAQRLGLSSTVEIFPKQRYVVEGGFGNWINLPYYGADRACISDTGRKLTLEDFLALAEKSKRDLVGGNSIYDYLNQAPPCIAHAIDQGLIGEGGRNNWVFHIAVFAKKTGLEILDALNEINSSFDEPLPAKEIVATAKSVEGKDYRYKCREPAIQKICRDFAMPERCTKCKFGVSADDLEELGSAVGAEFLSAVYWLNGEGGQVESITLMYSLSDRDGEQSLTIRPLDFVKASRVKEGIFLSSHVLVQEVKQKKWETTVNTIAKTYEAIPAEASDSQRIIKCMAEYLDNYETTQNTDGVKTGKVLIKETNGETVYLFNPQTLENYIKATMSGFRLTPQLFAEMSIRHSLGRSRVKIGNTKPTLWSIPQGEIEKIRQNEVRFSGSTDESQSSDF